MVNLTELLTILLITLGCILLIVLIILCIKMMKTIKKANYLIDDMTKKSEQLDTAFEIMEKSTNFVDRIGDKIIGLVAGSIKKLANKFRKEDKDEEEW